jgi:hypothetical protein
MFDGRLHMVSVVVPTCALYLTLLKTSLEYTCQLRQRTGYGI